MLRLCVCDDNDEELFTVRALIDEFAERYPQYPLQAVYFNDPYPLLEALEESGRYDLFLLDIIMPHMSGIELAQNIRKRSKRAKLVFLTTSREYGIEAIGMKASGYLLKPIQEQAFFDTVLSCIEELAPENDPSILVKTKLGLTRVQISELMLIESFDHVQELTLRDGGKLEATAKLSELEELLRDASCFISPHRAYLINMEYIRGLNNNNILMTNGRQIPVSKKLYADVKTAYLDYMTRA